MRLIFCLFLLLFLNNCSLNKDSQYWTEDSIKKKGEQKKLSKILKKSKDITTMTLEEYKLYIEDPLKIKTTEETYNDVYKRVKKEYLNTNNSVFVSHQDTIRSFTFYELDDKNFNENKPDHCSVHEIIKNKLIIHTYLD